MTMLAQAQITEIRMPDGRTISLVDWTDRPMYSTLDIEGGANDPLYTLFGYLSGDPVQSSSNVTNRRTSSDRDTNIEQAGGLASTEELLIYSVKPEFFQLTDTGTPIGNSDNWTIVSATPTLLPNVEPQILKQLHRLLLLRLRVSKKYYMEAGLGYYATGFGVDVASGSAARGIANSGSPGAYAARPVVIPVHVGGQEKYAVEIVNPAGVPVLFTNAAGAAYVAGTQAVVTCRVHLDGLYKRPTG
jgi:hypothetical protein